MKIRTSLLAVAAAGAMLSSAQAQETDLATLDSDTDGKVTVAEFKTYVSQRLPGFDQIDEFIKKVDADSNGVISADEFSSRMEKLAAYRDNSTPPQDDEKDAAGEIEAAQKAYKKLGTMIGDLEFEAASKRMTAKAKDTLCVQMVTMAVGFANADFPMEIPGFSDTQDELRDVVDVYGLDKLDLDTESMFRFEMSSGDEPPSEESEDSPGGTLGQSEEQIKALIATLDKDGKRWEIITAIWKVQQKSPFAQSPISGKIDEAEMDGDVVLLTVTAKQPEADGGGGVQLQIMSPPTVIRMEKSKDSWFYAGVDEARTLKKMEKFMENMGGGFERTDF